MRLHQLFKSSLLTLAISFSSNTFSQVTSQMSPDASIVDNIISDNVTKAIGENKLLSDARIRVSTAGGVVTLSGHVHSKEQEALAIKIAKTESAIPQVDTSKFAIKDDLATETAATND